MYRQDKKSVQRVRARDIVPGDIVEVAGEYIIIKDLERDQDHPQYGYMTGENTIRDMDTHKAELN